MPTPEQVRAAVDAYVSAYSTSDREAFLSVWSPEAWIIDPVGSPVSQGPDGRAAFWDSVHALSPEIRLIARDVVVCADEAAVTLEIHAAGSVIDAIDIFSVDDSGRISSMKAYWDMARMRQAD
ncbi:MAG: delta(5)-3-ketosteroid isomerase [Actinomycetia bacterium]|nr:delta(5)-3-ketosteroid isomerase [Actinomycetes bacterium]